jgi:hypothetical protein
VEEFRTLHRDFQKGIYVPAGEDVAVSIRFRIADNADYGYADRWIEEGVELDYTGQGAPPRDQSWNRFNLGLLNAEERGAGVHVFEELATRPKTFWHHGSWRVVRHYVFRNQLQQRTILRFRLRA